MLPGEQQPGGKTATKGSSNRVVAVISGSNPAPVRPGINFAGEDAGHHALHRAVHQADLDLGVCHPVGGDRFRQRVEAISCGAAIRTRPLRSALSLDTSSEHAVEVVEILSISG